MKDKPALTIKWDKSNSTDTHKAGYDQNGTFHMAYPGGFYSKIKGGYAGVSKISNEDAYQNALGKKLKVQAKNEKR